jgi:hypothetical protein
LAYFLTTTGFASLAISLLGMLMCAVSRLEGGPLGHNTANQRQRRIKDASAA